MGEAFTSSRISTKLPKLPRLPNLQNSTTFNKLAQSDNIAKIAKIQQTCQPLTKCKNSTTLPTFNTIAKHQQNCHTRHYCQNSPTLPNLPNMQKQTTTKTKLPTIHTLATNAQLANQCQQLPNINETSHDQAAVHPMANYHVDYAP